MPDVADASGRRMGRILKLPSACWPDTPVAGLPGVGPARARGLARLGIVTAADLLLHLPRRYEDTRDLVPVRELRAGVVQTVRVRVREVRAHHSPRRHMALVEATLEDGGGSVVAIWFNQPYIAGQVPPAPSSWSAAR